MILFVQPFGLHSPGGGPRILRALLKDAPQPFMSVCTAPQSPPPTDIGPETHLPLRPHFGRIESTRFGVWMGVADSLSLGRFAERLENFCRTNRVTGIHAIPHNLDFQPAWQVAKALRLPFYLSVHDDLAYALQNRPELRAGLAYLRGVWPQAQTRAVISEEMGQEYCRCYGTHPYILVTDGLENIPARPLARPEKSRRVYFMGAIHRSYVANFRALQQALFCLRAAHPAHTVSLTVRGGALPEVEQGISARLLPWASEAEVAQDLEEADWLYLPLPFDRAFERFYRFSLSTKMVTYLGSGLPILYHGPAEAAAGRLLARHEAALIHSNLNPDGLLRAIEAESGKRADRVNHALNLGRTHFLLSDQRQRFWNALSPAG